MRMDIKHILELGKHILNCVWCCWMLASMIQFLFGELFLEKVLEVFEQQTGTRKSWKQCSIQLFFCTHSKFSAFSPKNGCFGMFMNFPLNGGRIFFRFLCCKFHTFQVVYGFAEVFRPGRSSPKQTWRNVERMNNLFENTTNRWLCKYEPNWKYINNIKVAYFFGGEFE